LSSALTGIISQRLAKKLCEKCRQEKEADAYEKKVFKLVLDQDVDKIYVAHEEGCPNCHNGYKGRIAIQEVLEINDAIRDALANEKMEKEDIKKLVYESDVISLLQDGLLKVLDGYTSFDEIYRIIEIDTDEHYHSKEAEEQKKEVQSVTDTNNKVERKEEVAVPPTPKVTAPVQPLPKATPTTVAEQHNEIPRNLNAQPLPVNATFSGLPLNKPLNMP